MAIKMREILKLALLITITFGCVEEQRTMDYFGQNPPLDSPQKFASDVVSVKNRLDYGISFSPDGQELAYGILDVRDESGQIYYSKKVNNKWLKPEIASFLGNHSMFLPFFTPDGKSLLYTQTQQDSATYITDIWMVNKSTDGWGKPSKLPDPISSDTREGSVCMTLDKTLYFSSGRNCSGIVNCPAKIFYSKLLNGKYLTAKNTVQLNIQGDNESIYVSADESFAILSNVTRDETNSDLFISYCNANNEWIQPQKLDSTINTKDWELRPFVSPDKKYLFFTRMHFGKLGVIESDIYWVSTKNILKQIKNR